MSLHVNILPTVTPRPIKRLNLEIENSPLNAKLYYERGLAYYETVNIPEKYFQFEKGIYYRRILNNMDDAIRLDNSNPEYYFRRAVILSVMWDRKKDDVKYNRIVQDVQKAIQLEPKNRDYYLFRSEVFIEMGQFSEAFADYERAMEHFPNDYEIVLKRAYFFEKINDYPNSEKEFKKALAIAIKKEKSSGSHRRRPKNPLLLNPTLYNERGHFYFRWKKYKLAIQDFKCANKIHHSTFYLEKVSRCLIKLKDYESALKLIEYCLRKKTRNYLYFVTKGIILRKMKKYKTSLQVFDESIRRSGKSQSSFFTAYYEKGKTFYEMKLYKKSWKEFHKNEIFGLKNLMTKDLYKNYFWKGMAGLRRKRVRSAIQDFSKGIELITEHIVRDENIPFKFCYYYRKLTNYFAVRAEAYFLSGELEKSFNDYRTIIEIYQKQIPMHPKSEKPRFLKSIQKIVMNQNHILSIMIKKESEIKRKQVEIVKREQRGREREALRHFQKGVSLANREKRYQKGLKEISKALELWPQNKKFRVMFESIKLDFEEAKKSTVKGR